MRLDQLKYMNEPNLDLKKIYKREVFLFFIYFTFTF
jgi:hypothetical protein